MTFSEGQIGDKGQRYQVEGRDRTSREWEVIGWAEDEDGGGLAEGVRLWPKYDDVRVVDRRPE